ncbi:nucleotidyl transferase AbiEii/AbiGii toxin family protein [Myxococcus sp. SDU36]|uniref:nucleotidyl transferase AbiEii/AbiGii toxin family protein n=1 Tax=Myxococcus sp. SDU36 TaxID=2831967 RepID=UPI0025431FE1|nr:nucleotidyl transferase AbiEii/AbiGii toxin family protein [Myxococcus sp. SDU36]WIG94055.1 nucleotidyl transferase AbiEii/AbiGii toxin family protein [Myxococcus sp. SDU36]
MTEAFLRLESEDRRNALEVAASRCGRPVHLLEKDVWVVWALNVMFSASFGEHLVFKGGTSLSKVYGAIRRFSEDVDLTYDIRAIAPDLTDGQTDPLPNGSQQKRWTKVSRERLGQWVSSTVLPTLSAAIDVERVPATVSVRPDSPDAIQIAYQSVSPGSGYVSPVVLLEFGARSTGEPSEERWVQCDVAQYLPTLEFPVARPRVMRVERTFWEKATAIHVMCSGAKIRTGRFSRHWYDLVQLDKTGHAASALEDRTLANQVAAHKSWFFEEKVDGKPIDYATAVTGGLRLVPKDAVLAALRDDYQKMVADGLLLDAAEPFDTLLERCRQIEERANRAGQT